MKRTRHNGTVAAVGLSATAAPSISGATLTLTLAEALVSTDRDVKVSYEAPDAGTDNRLRGPCGQRGGELHGPGGGQRHAGAGRARGCVIATGTVVRPEHFTLTATASTVMVSYTDQDADLSNQFLLYLRSVSRVA